MPIAARHTDEISLREADPVGSPCSGTQYFVLCPSYFVLFC